jgi:hypothetical protein
MSTEQAQAATRRGPFCVGVGAVLGPLIALLVMAAAFPAKPYERALPWILGAIPFGAFIGLIISRFKRRR